MRDCKQTVAPESRSVGFAKWPFETLAVNLQAIVFSRERRDSADRCCGFTRKVSGFLVCFLVELVLKDDDTLGALNQRAEQRRTN